MRQIIPSKIKLEDTYYTDHKERKKRHKKEGADNYLKSTHTYELVISGESTGIVRSMTGREAHLINAENMIKFGNNTRTRLNRWAWKKSLEQ